MTRILLSLVMVSLVTGCGVKRALIRPADIPAFEETQRKKRERLGIETPAAATAKPTTENVP